MSKTAMERALSAAGPQGVLVLAALAKLESNAPEHAKAGFYASAANIAAACGLGTRTIFRILPVLEKARLFLMESGRKNSAGGYQANKFQLLDVGPEAPPPYAHGTERYAAESCFSGTQERNSPRKGERKSPRSALRTPAGAPAGGQEDETENPFAWEPLP